MLDANYVPTVTYTQPDRRQGRGRNLTPSPVKALAVEQGISVEQPQSLKDAEIQARFKQHQLDVLIVVAYGLILPDPVLEAPRLGCLNVHASLLPRWRGAAPLERAYIEGDEEAGVCIMQMESGLDTGPVYIERRFTMPKRFRQLEQSMLAHSQDALIEGLNAISRGDLGAPSAQTGTATYAHKLTAADRDIDWNQDAHRLSRQIEALSDRAPVRCQIGGKQIQLLEAEVIKDTPPEGPVGAISGLEAEGFRIRCATHELLIKRIKLEGRGVSSAADAINGYPDLFSLDAQCDPINPA